MDYPSVLDRRPCARQCGPWRAGAPVHQSPRLCACAGVHAVRLPFHNRKRCSARLVFHRGDKRLKCHHCGDSARVPEACEECNSIVVVAVGEGTERIEQALARDSRRTNRRADREKRGDMERFIEARACARDRYHGRHANALQRVTTFPISHWPVSSMRTARCSPPTSARRSGWVAQLIQVAGRAGRAERVRRVLIQTRFVSHPFYRAVVANDYTGFARLADERRAAHLPPFSHLALLRAEGRSGGGCRALCRRGARGCIARAVVV